MHRVYSLLFLVLVRPTFAGISYNWAYTYDASFTVWNPFKGFVPYYYDTKPQPSVNFPHSMENQYIPMKALMTGPSSFNFSSLETILTNVAKRNHHAIVRVYVDYPGRDLNSSIPDFLVNGLAIYSGTVKQGLFPDYNNQTLIDAMLRLIRALGRQYDGDIRIGFWEIGFLGHWGEWHTFPNVSRFATRDHQDQILFAYNSSFLKTKLQLRYPHVSGNYNVTSWNVGFHDDSFFLDTYGEYWMFYNRSVVVGATQQWRRHPIGGEVRPELQPCVFASDPPTACKALTELIPLNWTTCVELTHSTYQWLSNAFHHPGYNGSDYERAINGSIMQGYSFFVPEITAKEVNCSGTLVPQLFPRIVNVSDPPFSSLHAIRLGVTMLNRGLAPFYYPLTLNTKGIDADAGSVIAFESSPVPIEKQVDQQIFVSYFDMTIKSNTNVQFSVWLNSSHLVGNQSIVFAVSNASITGTIQLPTVFIGNCAI